MLDTYSRAGGVVDPFELVHALKRVHRERNPMIDRSDRGIHEAHYEDHQVPGGESWTPLLSFAQFPEDGTATA